MMRSKTSLALLLAATSLAGAGTALAESAYPDEPVEFIVPWSPGGGSDTLMRVVANHAEAHLEQPLPVINMPGVSGTTGLKELSRRDADGYTIGQVHEGLLVAHHTGLTPLNYDDFEPVAAVTQSPQYLTVPADAPYETFGEFVDYAQDNPGEVRFGVTLGGVPHIHAAMMEEAEDLQFRYVGFEGTGPRVRALVGGHIDAAIGDVSSAGEFVKNGDLRFLAVGSAERQSETPEVPTFAELGHPELKLNIIRGILAPAGTPEERIATLASALEAMTQDEGFADAIHNAGASVAFKGPQAFGEYLETSDATIERLSGKLAR
ncbi:Bug family tripartite tricarboxylate transporter substrate binding protein [Halomonas borealis]|jgi:tripartite-type tricarboxylate transporter receptor subunit TctC|uniref:Bug family tripartite tricarboxylate transporter substrate binding protein n=1 Tax=Halomonas borealis TaxID=2508710 RepID=UPI00197AE086|nr:tripartite tricarboxylate transporter substrate binding protein [Halomonas borealis]